ncbi:unnamed protein product [Fusarium graminearum]|nr:unnamed protein product [Fusarium graminearum]
MCLLASKLGLFKTEHESRGTVSSLIVIDSPHAEAAHGQMTWITKMNAAPANLDIGAPKTRTFDSPRLIMKFSAIACAALSIFGGVQAAKSPFFILTGDSTVATGGGWGDALLNGTKKPGGGINLAKNGATTVSFRDLGLWDAALDNVKTQKAKHEAIVTIQFGHNDQKTLTLEQYSDNLSTMIGEVKAAGGTAIIITSLTRRTFKDGKVVENLSKERDAAIGVANKAGVKYLDLNTASTKYVNAIGQENADKYNEIEGDRTHLNMSGKIVFGRMVADMLVQKRPDLARYIKSNKKLSQLIRDGVFTTGQE